MKSLLSGLFIFFGSLFFGTAVLAQALKGPFVLKTADLEAGKVQIRKKNPEYTAALRELLSQADTVLKNKPYSVTYKQKTPPSGDKHDYMSVGPYWWPDPTKPDGLPYIRKDGQVNPERNAVQDASYHAKLCNDVYKLALAYYYSGNKKYAAKADELLKVWFLNQETRMNPNLNFGQAIPGITNGRGIGIIDTRMLAMLIDGVELLQSGRGLPAATYTGVKSWYSQFMDWMLNSPIGKDEADEHNNHGTWYDVQTTSMALFTGKSDLARKIVEETVKGRIESQLAKDGSQPHELARTLSWNYSQMNLQGFFILGRLAENIRIDLYKYTSPGGKSLKSAFAWMLPYAKDEKPWVEKQIKTIDNEGYLYVARTASGIYPDLDIAPLLKAKPTDYLWTLTRFHW